MVPSYLNVLSRIQTLDLIVCLYLNLKHGEVDNPAIMACCTSLSVISIVKFCLVVECQNAWIPDGTPFIHQTGSNFRFLAQKLKQNCIKNSYTWPLFLLFKCLYYLNERFFFDVGFNLFTPVLIFQSSLSSLRVI